MPTFIADLVFAWRLLRKSPGFTLTAILTLALGIGANTAVFTMLNALVFKPLPGVERPAEMVWLSNQQRSGHAASLAFADVVAMREGTSAFREVLAYAHAPLNLGSGGEPERITGALVTGNYFSALGVRMALGSGFAAAEDRAQGTSPVVVLSHGLWQRRFASDPAAVGGDVVLNGRRFTVVGVAPPEFGGTELADHPPELFVPLAMYAWAAPSWPNPFGEEGAWQFRAMARLAPGATLARARAELTALAERLGRRDPEDQSPLGFHAAPVSGRVHAQDQGDVAGLAALGFGIAGLVLLIACANVANLLLGRAASRRREMGIRVALGAARSRMVRQLLTESALLAALAGLASVVLSAWAIDALVALVGLPFALDLSPDLRVLAAALGVSVVATGAFGLAPAVLVSSEAVVPALADGSPGSGRPRRARLQRVLVVGEVALSLVLVVAAGLLVRSLAVASGLDRGFDASDRVLAAALDPGAQGLTGDRRAGFVRDLVEAAAGLPGVERASAAALVPMGGIMWGARVTPEGQSAGAAGGPMVYLNSVWPGFFDAVGMALVAGRDFTTADRTGSPPVAVVNERLAEALWPGQSAIGRRLRLGGGAGAGPWLTVVAVARNVTDDADGEQARPFLFTPWLQAGAGSGLASGTVSLLVRVSGDAAPVAAALRHVVKRLDATLPVYDVRTLGAIVGERLAPRRAGSVVLNLFGALALAVAAVGLYGVMTLAVAERRREFGVRLALGASPTAVMGSVFREGLGLAAAGAAVGLVLSVAATRVIAGGLAGVSALDPVAYGVSLATLGLVAAVAVVVPAFRATRVDPAVALRSE